ncbi:MAG TPA: stress protein [Chloroflexi bacterium]|nr:stress protein [Chloroflexota bacterium]
MKTKNLWLPFVLFLILVTTACGNNNGSQKITADDVVTAFKNAGLEAESTTKMTKDDYGMAPFVCEGTRFLIPSLGDDSGGRIFICEKKEDLDNLAKYYNDLGKSSAMFFSWVFTKGSVLVQINGDLAEDTAKKYEQAIP